MPRPPAPVPVPEILRLTRSLGFTQPLPIVQNRRSTAVVGGAQSGFALKITSAPEHSQVERERAALRSLQDLHIAPRALRWGRSAELAWLQMEWIDGPTLATRLADRLADHPAQPEQPPVEVFTAVARTLATVHAAGWLHGDIQPSHIIFPADGSLRLIDWGNALGPDRAHPYHGALVHYAPPEVARAMLADEAFPYDVPQEIYALAASFYTAWTRQTVYRYPLDAPFRDKLGRIAGSPLPRLDLPPSPLRTTLERCLGPAAERPRDLEAVLGMLHPQG